MWFHYPEDPKTFGIDLQFFYGDYLLVSPVTQENSTSVDIYLPGDTFYDFTSFAPVTKTGTTLSLTNVGFTDIPLHIRGGGVLPMRVESAMTTAELREKDFQLVIAPRANGTATGSLYIDDGVSVEQKKTTEVSFTYAKGELKAKGKFHYDVGKVKVAKVIVLGVSEEPKGVSVSGGKSKGFKWDPVVRTVTAEVEIPLTGDFSVKLK